MRLLDKAFIGDTFLQVQAFVLEDVHILNYYFLVGAFIARTFTRGGIC